jgi:hypothetical protein
MSPLDVDAERLELAKANLAKVDVVGTQETFDDVLADLRERFGWDMGSAENIHVTPGKREVPESFRRRIAADNPADMEFYAFAQELRAGRRRSQRSTPGERSGGGGTV